MNITSKISFKSILLAAASGAALCLSAGSAANAQCLPNMPNPGDTVTCAAGTYNGTPITYNVDDLTVVIGDTSSVTLINSQGVGFAAIELRSSTGNIVLDMRGSPSGYGGEYVTVRTGNNYTQQGHGIYARSEAGGGDIILSTTGGVNSFNQVGMYVLNYGTGRIDIGAQYVTSGNGVGLRIVGHGSDIDIDIVDGLSGRSGGSVANDGSGNTSVDVGGQVYGRFVSQNALRVTNEVGSGDLSVNVGSVRANGEGLILENYGSGATSVQTGLTNCGGTCVDVTHGNSGAVIVTTTGQMTAGGDGVRVSGGAIDVATSGVNATGDGIVLDPTNGALVTATGLTQCGGTCVDVRTNDSGDIRVDSVDVDADAGPGIYVNTGAGHYGDVIINNTGSLASTYAYAIELNLNGTGGQTHIEVNDCSSVSSGCMNALLFGNSDGVFVTSTGASVGAIVLEVRDVENLVGANSRAIQLRIGAPTATVRITGDVNGGRFGLSTDSSQSVGVTLDAGASLTGGTAAWRADGGSNDTLNWSGHMGANVLLLSGQDAVTAGATATLEAGSRLDLGTDNDTLTVESDHIFGLSIRGGLGTDTLNLDGAGGTINSSGAFAPIRQFEILNVLSGDWVFQGAHRNYQSFDVAAGSSVTVDCGAVIFAGTTYFSSFNSDTNTCAMGTARIYAVDYVQDGNLYPGTDGQTGTLNIYGNLTQGATGSLYIDANSNTDRDFIRVLRTGDVSLDGTLNLNQSFALEEGQYVFINAVGDLTGTFATVNGLGSGAGFDQSIVYDRIRGRALIATTFSEVLDQDIGSKSAASAASYLIGGMGDTTDYAKLGFAVGTMDTFAEIGSFASEITPDVLDSAVMVSDGAALRFGNALAGCDMNFSLNEAESCAAVAGQTGPHFFGEMRQTSANTGTEVGHSFNANSFDMNFGLVMSDADDATQFGLMSGYAKSGSASDAIAGKARDGLEAESFSFGGFARRDVGAVSLDVTAMVSTSEAKLVRNITPGLGLAEQAQAEFVSRQLNLQGTATLNEFAGYDLSVKPLATLGNRTYQRDGFTESGANLLGLTVEGQTSNVSYLGLGAEISPDFTDENGQGFAGLLRVTGLAYAGDTENTYTARFTNAPGDRSFTHFGQDLDTSVLIEGGFKYIGSEGYAIGAEGFSEVNPRTGDISTVGATLQLTKSW